MAKKRLSGLASFWDAVTFYTIIPIPLAWQGNFSRIAHWASWVGIGIGGLLAIADILLQFLAIPPLTRAMLEVMLWVSLTRGLHLDGAMDTADGLAVTDPTRRLAVMQDSHTGAYGAIAAILILGLKAAALADGAGPWGLILAAGWGRWGQLLAIACYPYLKPTGKGAFHKIGLRLPHDLLWGLLPLLITEIVYSHVNSLSGALMTGVMGFAIAFLTSYSLHRRLGGHTGDSYGAIVEWTEALFLSSFVSWVHR